ncbi:MAG: SDR family oxidoreductase [Candidatus Dadabacteria bacterium]|nr:MAG: SDR family oxidoreductase [Candidatus Dadabacteria bacterium]
MKAVVTGGAGFIGSHLVEELLYKEGWQVTVLDNFSSGAERNLAGVKGHPNLVVIKADISNFQDIAFYFKEADYVFHLAALADIVPSVKDPLLYHRSNVDGTAAVLEAARTSSRLKKFLYAASSSCYGIADILPTPETAPLNPRYPYALTKMVGESYVMHWGEVYQLPVISLRFFNVYGPRARTNGTYGAVFGVFLAQKLAGKPFTVVGDGTQKRDFIFVSDVVSALITAAKSSVVQEIFNVGAGNPQSINYLVELLGGKKVYIPKRPGEPDCTYADISKIKRMLKWEPKISFKEGVKIMLENIDYWRDAPVWDPESINQATKEWFTYLK